MPGASLHKPRYADDGVYVVLGQFEPNGTSAPPAASIKGAAIESVTRTSTGDYDVVIRESYAKDFLMAFGSINYGSDADVRLAIVSYTPATRTLAITTLSAGTAANLTNAAGRTIDLQLVFRDSAVEAGNW